MLDGGGRPAQPDGEPTVDLDGLTRRIADMAAKIDAATGELLTAIRRFDAHGGWARQGFKTLAHWLGWCLGLDLRTAREYGRVARSLGDLPLLAEALARGEISYSKVRAITRVATPASEGELLGLAAHMTGAQLDRVVRRYQGLTVEGQGLGLEQDRRRFLKTQRLPSGMVRLVIQIGPEEAEAIERAVALAMGPPSSATPRSPADARNDGGSAEPRSPAEPRSEGGSAEPQPLANPRNDGDSTKPQSLASPRDGDGSAKPQSLSHRRNDGSSAQPRPAARPLDHGGSAEPQSLAGSRNEGGSAEPPSADRPHSHGSPAHAQPPAGARNDDGSAEAQSLAGFRNEGGSAEPQPLADHRNDGDSAQPRSPADPHHHFDFAGPSPVEVAGGRGCGDCCNCGNWGASTSGHEGSGEAFGATRWDEAFGIDAEGTEGWVRPPPPPKVPPEQNPNRIEHHTLLERRADALVQVAEAFLRRPSLASGAAHELVVHVDAETLARPDASIAGLLGDGRPLTSAVVRRLSCDAAMVAVARGEGGQTLDVGRRTRNVPPALRRALRLRDYGCRFPGCTSVLGADAHHIIHWADGGETTLDNLVLLCRHHHRLIHHDDFSVTRLPGDVFVFRDPQGDVVDETFVRQPLPAEGFEELEAWLRAHGMQLTDALERERWDGERLDLGNAIEALAHLPGT